MPEAQLGFDAPTELRCKACGATFVPNELAPRLVVCDSCRPHAERQEKRMAKDPPLPWET